MKILKDLAGMKGSNRRKKGTREGNGGECDKIYYIHILNCKK